MIEIYYFTHPIYTKYMAPLWFVYHYAMCFDCVIDNVAGPYTARPFITNIDIFNICACYSQFTFTDFDIFKACGRCH